MTDISLRHHLAQPHLSSGRLPTSDGQRETTPGLCRNLDYCSIGMQRVQVRVPISDPFVCPECGGALRAPLSRYTVRGAVVMPVLRIGVLIMAVTMAGGFGFSLGRLQPAMRQALASVTASPAPAAVPAEAAPPVMVPERPYPRLAPVEATNPPNHLLHETRFGQVTLDCALVAGSTQPACRVADLRGGDAFSAAALPFLRRLQVRYSSATPADHRWRIVFQDFAGAERPGSK